MADGGYGESPQKLKEHDRLRDYLDGQIPGKKLKKLKHSLETRQILQPKFLKDPGTDFSDIFTELCSEAKIGVGEYDLLIELLKAIGLVTLAKKLQKAQDNFPQAEKSMSHDKSKVTGTTHGHAETAKPDPNAYPHAHTESPENQIESGDKAEWQPPAGLQEYQEHLDSKPEAELMQCDTVEDVKEGFVSNQFIPAHGDQPQVYQRDVKDATSRVSQVTNPGLLERLKSFVSNPRRPDKESTTTTSSQLSLDNQRTRRRNTNSNDVIVGIDEGPDETSIATTSSQLSLDNHGTRRRIISSLFLKPDIILENDVFPWLSTQLGSEYVRICKLLPGSSGESRILDVDIDAAKFKHQSIGGLSNIIAEVLLTWRNKDKDEKNEDELFNFIYCTLLRDKENDIRDLAVKLRDKFAR